jgi:hypothetical protein
MKVVKAIAMIDYGYYFLRNLHADLHRIKECASKWQGGLRLSCGVAGYRQQHILTGIPGWIGFPLKTK